MDAMFKKNFLWDKLQSRKKNLNRTKLSTVVYYLHFNVNGDLFMGAVIALIFQVLMRSQLCKIDKKKKGALYECVEKESLIRIVYN